MAEVVPYEINPLGIFPVERQGDLVKRELPVGIGLTLRRKISTRFVIMNFVSAVRTAGDTVDVSLHLKT